MKIAYLIPRLQDTGLFKIPAWLSEQFYAEHSVKLFYFDETPSTGSVPSITVPTQKISFSSVAPELKEYDILHSHGLKPDAYIALHRWWLPGVKISTLHGYHTEELSFTKNPVYGWLWGHLWDFCCNQCDAVVCLTDTMAQYYQSRLPSTRITHIYNGIDFSRLPRSSPRSLPQRDPTDHRIKLVTVSSLNRRKGVEQLVRLLTFDPRYYLTAIGGDTEAIARLTQLAQQLGVESQCEFLEFTPYPWEQALKQNIFVFPSYSEGHPLSLLEAAYLGLPIICSDIPTFREMFTEEEVTFFPLDQIATLHHCVSQWENYYDKIPKVQTKVQTQFSLTTMGDHYIQLYRQLVNKKFFKEFK
jgi:glycosyltransferase involved in cell wall biosynthesis